MDQEGTMNRAEAARHKPINGSVNSIDTLCPSEISFAPISGQVPSSER
jgi:hypothetical protein